MEATTLDLEKKEHRQIMNIVVYQQYENACYIFLEQIFEGKEGWEVKRSYIEDNGVFALEVDTCRPFTTKELLLLARSDVMVSFENGLFVWRIPPLE